MPNYYKFKKLGEGTYAIIYLAKETDQGETKHIKTEPDEFTGFVVIKKIKKTEYSLGQEISAIREIKALKSLKGENIQELKDIFIHK
jgi:cyclin-dependent kinase 7